MNRLRQLLQQIEITNRRRHLLCRNDVLVIALSGGPDSMALLELLSIMRQKYLLKITAAHLDHGLSKQNKNYLSAAKKAAEKLRVPFYSKSIHLTVLAKRNKRSLEEMGRIERYKFFREVAKKVSAGKIVTAHTLDDQAETMLMRIFRGAGLRGLAGIPYQRAEGNYVVVRPLLDCSKKELLGFLKENHLPFCWDKTNTDPVFTRNRIRHNFLPQIERLFNPRIKQSLANLQSICQEAHEYLESVSEKALKKCTRKRTSRSLLLDISRLKRLHPSILSETLFKALSALRGDSKRFSHEHLSALSEALWSNEEELEISLPGVVTAKKKYGTLTIASIDTPAK